MYPVKEGFQNGRCGSKATEDCTDTNHELVGSNCVKKCNMVGYGYKTKPDDPTKCVYTQNGKTFTTSRDISIFKKAMNGCKPNTYTNDKLGINISATYDAANDKYTSPVINTEIHATNDSQATHVNSHSCVAPHIDYGDNKNGIFKFKDGATIKTPGLNATCSYCLGYFVKPSKNNTICEYKYGFGNI